MKNAVVLLLCIAFPLQATTAWQEPAEEKCSLTAYFLGFHAAAHLSCENASVGETVIHLVPGYFQYLAIPLTPIFALFKMREYSLSTRLLAVAVAWLVPLPGMIMVYDSNSSLLPFLRPSKGTPRRSYNISASQARAIRDRGRTMELACDHLPDESCLYNLVGRNCIDFVQELCDVASREEHFTNSLDGTYSKLAMPFAWISSTLHGWRRAL